MHAMLARPCGSHPAGLGQKPHGRLHMKNSLPVPSLGSSQQG